MKKSIIILLILFLPIISAVTINMNEEFSQGETLMAKVSGNFFESITKEDIFFYERHVKEPMSPFITKINNDFYIYAQLFDKPENNYSMVVKNVMYIKGGLVFQEDFTKYFSISNSTADFSINPGFISTDKNFFIEVENLQDSETTISVVTSSIVLETSKPITLTSGATKKIYFSINNLTQPTFELIGLSTGNSQYKIPVYVFGVSGGDPECTSNDSCRNSTCVGSTCTDSCGNIYGGILALDCTGRECGLSPNTCGNCGTCSSGENCVGGTCVWGDDTCENVGTCKTSCDEDSQDLGKLDCGFFSTCCQESVIDSQKIFNFEQSELKITMPTNSHTIREIYIYNTGNKTIKDISLTISGELKNYISLSPDTIDELEPDSNVKIELEFYSFNKDVEVQGKITAKEQGISTFSEISLDIIKDYIPEDKYKYTPSNQIKTCAELGGKICSSGEECDTDYVYAKDNKCCLGKCGGEVPSSSGKIIGWSIIGIVVVFLIWFFMKKYRGAKKPLNLLDIAKGKK